MVPHCAFLETVPLTQAQKLTKLFQEHPREKLPAGIFGISYRLIVSGSLHNFMVSKKKIIHYILEKYESGIIRKRTMFAGYNPDTKEILCQCRLRTYAVHLSWESSEWPEPNKTINWTEERLELWPCRTHMTSSRCDSRSSTVSMLTSTGCSIKSHCFWLNASLCAELQIIHHQDTVLHLEGNIGATTFIIG